jgi:hypothetical protein
MRKLTRADLYTLEKYAEARRDFRAKLIEHKKDRRLAIGPDAALYFEDRLTVQYQIQEMLRVEKIFEPAGIDEELEAYNPLIPDGSNWKATFMLEYEDETERRKRLAELLGIEARVWLRVQGMARIQPFYNEDIDRSAEDKTASVHFMRFELSPAMVKALKNGAGLAAGIDHPRYNHTVDPVPANILKSLIDDLD